MTEDSPFNERSFMPGPAEYAEDAALLEAEAEQHPDTAEQYLTEAAAYWVAAGEHEHALELLDRILAGAPEAPQLVRAIRVEALWEVQGEHQARAAATELRSEKPDAPEVWDTVADAFQGHGDPATAAEWWTAAITHFLGPEPEVDVDEIIDSRPELHILFTERHLARHEMGLPHDAWDEVAAGIEALYEAEEGDLDDEFTDEAFADAFLPPGVDKDTPVYPPEPRFSPETGFLFWPKEQLTEVIRRWPETAEGYGEDHAEHLREVERSLRAYSSEGQAKVSVVTGDVEELAAYAEEQGASPADTSLRARFAAEKVRRGEDRPWPPERNAPCWCGSERKYKKCCGNPALR